MAETLTAYGRGCVIYILGIKYNGKDDIKSSSCMPLQVSDSGFDSGFDSYL